MSGPRRPRRTSSIKPMAEMNLTSMMDLTFLLLITFIITFPMIEQGIPVKLPKGKSRQMDAQKKTSSVTVDDEGRIYLGDKLVDYDGLARELEARVTEEPELKLVVRGDVETKFGGVAEVMRIAERAGVRSMAVATKDEGGGD